MFAFLMKRPSKFSTKSQSFDFSYFETMDFCFYELCNYPFLFFCPCGTVMSEQNKITIIFFNYCTVQQLAWLKPITKDASTSGSMERWIIEGI
jgi:hypothetical protein